MQPFDKCASEYYFLIGPIARHSCKRIGTQHLFDLNSLKVCIRSPEVLVPYREPKIASLENAPQTSFRISKVCLRRIRLECRVAPRFTNFATSGHNLSTVWPSASQEAGRNSCRNSPKSNLGAEQEVVLPLEIEAAAFHHSAELALLGLAPHHLELKCSGICAHFCPLPT
jgi:hypothetical protein